MTYVFDASDVKGSVVQMLKHRVAQHEVQKDRTTSKIEKRNHNAIIRELGWIIDDIEKAIVKEPE